MRSLHGVALLAAAVPLSTAFQFTFYSGFDCRGERLDRFQASLGDGCQDGGNAGRSTTSVLITPEDGDGIYDTVVFFPQGADCAIEQALATGNVGCIETIPDVGSFRVISGEAKKREARSAVLRPRSAGLGITHGDFFEMRGELWRWAMVAQDTFSGVRPEDWNETTHVAKRAAMDFGADYPFNFTQWDLDHPDEAPAVQHVTDDEIAEFNLNRGTSANPAHDLAIFSAQRANFCRAVRDCAQGFAILTEFYFPRATAQLINAINYAKPAAVRIWEHITTPFITQVSVSFGTGWVAANYFNQNPTPEPPPAPSCPSTGNDETVMRTAINDGLGPTSRFNVMSNDIYDGSGNPTTLATAVAPIDVIGNGNCQTPTQDDIRRLKLTRHKRSLYANVPGFEEWLATKDFSF